MMKPWLVMLQFSSFFSLSLGETSNMVDCRRSSVEGSIDFSHCNSLGAPMWQPWIIIPGLPDQLPICYNNTWKHMENIVRISQVLCRHSGYMTATKWFPTMKDGGFRKGLVASSYCRGDEQMITHCQWHEPIYNVCNEFLALECGDCSSTLHLNEESSIMLTSPGFPFYVPLVMCEWNITLIPEHNLVIRFQQLDLPSPIYDESSGKLSSLSGSLDILPYRTDINRFTFDHRFCGHHNPGNLTIFSNRVLIRFIAGNYKLDTDSKKGFAAEFFSVPANLTPSSTIITRWVLIGCAVFLASMFVISLWFCKERWSHFRHHCCCCRIDPISSNNGGIGQQLAFSSNNFSQIRISQSHQSPYFPSNHHRRNTKSPTTDASDCLHCQQTQRLEKWQSARLGTSDGENFKAIEISSFPSKEDSHIYEFVEQREGNENSVYLNLSE